MSVVDLGGHEIVIMSCPVLASEKNKYKKRLKAEKIIKTVVL
jgi:hypothetical protein